MTARRGRPRREIPCCVLAEVRRLRALGVSWRDLAGDMGMGVETLRRAVSTLSQNSLSTDLEGCQAGPVERVTPPDRE